jgi:metal-sulfur cluster biosynthetic enzyme
MTNPSPSTSLLPDKAKLLDALRQVIDPEIGINIVDIGLIYRLDIAADGSVLTIEMTMTSPACPMGEMMIEEIETVLREQLPETMACKVRLVWEPPWSPAMMTERARKHFGW